MARVFSGFGYLRIITEVVLIIESISLYSYMAWELG